RVLGQRAVRGRGRAGDVPVLQRPDDAPARGTDRDDRPVGGVRRLPREGTEEPERLLVRQRAGRPGRRRVAPVRPGRPAGHREIRGGWRPAMTMWALQHAARWARALVAGVALFASAAASGQLITKEEPEEVRGVDVVPRLG